MENPLEKRIHNPEISLKDNGIALYSEDNPDIVSDVITGLPPDLSEAIKQMYYRNSNLKRDMDAIKARENSIITADTKDNEAKIISFLDLLNKEFPEIPWDIEQIFESGTINMISAPPNQYKSWIVHHMAICLAQGKSVFRQFKTKTQNVLIVNEEDGLRMIKDRSLKMIDEAKELRIHFMAMSGFKINEDTVKEIIKEAQKRSVTFIIFDSLRSIHDADENNSQEMQKIMDQFKLLTKIGITVLFTHHNRKKAFGKSKDEFGEESRGSTAINAGVHGHISCEEILRDDGKYLVITQRKLKCDEKIKPFSVKIDIDKVNNKMNFNYVGEYDAKEDSFRKNKELTMTVIENSDRWLSKKEIALQIGVGSSALAKILKELEKDRLIDSKEKRELVKLNVAINDTDTKHNAKFYFRKDKSAPDERITDFPEDDDF